MYLWSDGEIILRFWNFRVISYCTTTSPVLTDIPYSWKLFNAFLQNSNMINPKASSWPVRFCIIWFLPPFQPHLPPVAPCLPVPTIMVFCLFPKHATLIPPRKTWHLLLSPPGIIFSQALSPEWIPIFSDTTSLEGSSPATVLKKPSHSFF